MKIILMFITIFSLLFLVGCTSSEQTSNESENTQIPTEEKTIKKTDSNKIDTITVNIDKSEKPSFEQKTITPLTSSQNEYAPPKGKYSVQVGAYKMPDNADRIAELARERFDMKVYTTFDSEAKLYKVLIGDFETKESARSFRDSITLKYPDDYKDAWVCENP